MRTSSGLRSGVAVVLAGLLLAACGGGSSGGTATGSGSGAAGTATNASGTSSLPNGLGGSTGAHGSKSASKGAKASGSHTAGQGSSTPGGGSSSTRSGGGGGGGKHGGGGSHSSTPTHPTSSAVDNGCRTSAPPKASDPSKAVITVCPAIGLSASDTVTITGHSFKANEGLIATECHYLGENANNYGLSQCNIGNIFNFKPARTVRSDANGNVGPVTLTVVNHFKRIDCTTSQCLISVAVPLQSGSADNPHVLIYFG